VTDPTGLDYQAAFETLYPGLAAEGRRAHDLPDDRLRLVDRAARLRRTERERVKSAVEGLVRLAERGDMEFLSSRDQAAMIRKTLEEIR
jgi:hypothetical protein